MPQVAGFAIGALGFAGSFAVPAAMSWGVAAGATFAASTLGGIAVKLLGTVALSALAGSMRRKPDGNQAAGLRTGQTLSGGVNPESFILGGFATNGAFVAPYMSHQGIDGPPNGYLNYVIEVAGIPGHELDGLLINGERVEILEDLPHVDYGKRIGGAYLSKAWIKYYNGMQTAADPMLLAKYPVPMVRPWSTGMIGTGICYAILTFKFDREIFQSWPQVRFEIGGLPVYDPRKDSTVSGGSGTQRWGNRSTYERSNNNCVIIYNVLRGITLPNGQLWGGAIPTNDIPLSSAIAAMNQCDKIVDNGVGGTEKQYRAGIEVFVDDEPWTIIEHLLTGCSGALAETGGRWTMRAGGPGLPVMHITDDDLINSEPDDFKPFPSIDSVYNAIEATYPDPESAWESRDAKPIYNLEWEELDGDRRLIASLSLNATPFPDQCQRLMSAAIKDHRRMRVHVITLPAEARILEALDTISWSSTSNGYSSKLFEIKQSMRDPWSGNITLTLREVNPTDFDPPTDIIRPDAPDRRPVVILAQAVPGWSAVPWIIKDAEENFRRAAARLSWTPDAVSDARGIKWAVRLAGETHLGEEWPLFDVLAGAAIIELLPNTSYEIRAKIVANRPTIWSDWIYVKTPDVKITQADLDAEILEVVDGWHAWLNGDAEQEGGRWRATLEDLRQVHDEAIENASEKMLSQWQDRKVSAAATQQLRVRIDQDSRELTVIAEAVTALQAVIPSLATADALQLLRATVISQANTLVSQAEAITMLEADLGGKASASALSSLSGTVVDQGGVLSALTTALQSLGAVSPAGAAQAMLKMEAASNAGGVSSTIGLRALAGNSSDSSRVAALFLEALASGGSRVVVQGDAFYVVINGTRVPMLVADGAGLRLHSSIVKIYGDMLVAGTITADKLVDESIVVPGRDFRAPLVTLSSHSLFTTLAEVTIQRKGKPVEINAQVTLGTVGWQGFSLFEVVRDGVHSVGSWNHATHPNGFPTQASFKGVDMDTGTGAATYTLRARKLDPAINPAAANANLTVENRYLSVTSFIR